MAANWENTTPIRDEARRLLESGEMTMEEWEEFKIAMSRQRQGHGFENFLSISNLPTVTKWLQDRKGAAARADKTRAPLDPAYKGPPVDPEEERRKAQAAALKAFQDEMLKPLDMNDPQVQQIIQSAAGIGRQNAANRGIEGGAATCIASRAVADAALGLRNQRANLGLQAAGLDMTNQQNVDALNERRFEYDTSALNDSNAQQWQWDQSQRQGAFGLAGGLVGGIAGAYLGRSPQSAMYGFQAGSQLGAGIGGMTSGAPPRWSPASSRRSGMQRDNSGGY